MKPLFSFCFAVAVLLAGCRNDPSGPPITPLPPSISGVYVLNEGLFGQANSTLTYLDIRTLQVFQDVFRSVNNRDLGDVGNSIVVFNGKAYIIVNNSHKIEVMDVATNQSAGTVDMGAGRSPRNIVFRDDSTGLVSNLFDNSVMVVNLRTLTTGQRIPVGPNPDGIAIAGNRAFVANSGLGTGRSVSVIDLGTLSVIATLEIGDNPVEVYRISADLLYVLCAGFYNNFLDPDDDTPAKLYVLQAQSLTLIDSIHIGGHAFKMGIGPHGRGYLPVADSVLVLNTNQHSIVGTLARGRAFYGVAVDSLTSHIYLSDPMDFAAPGKVYAYNESGDLLFEFSAGLIPGSIAFKR